MTVGAFVPSGFVMTIAEPRAICWDRQVYYRLAEQGWFEGRRVQLIDGEIIEMSPQRHPHSAAIELVRRALESVFPGSWWIRDQLPLSLSMTSDPEPDLAVVPGSPRDYSDHPSAAHLVVEVADMTLAFDKSRKLRLYAAAGIPEYWIVDLTKRRVLVFRQPSIESQQYALKTICGEADSLTPLSAPQRSIRIADILP